MHLMVLGDFLMKKPLPIRGSKPQSKRALAFVALFGCLAMLSPSWSLAQGFLGEEKATLELAANRSAYEPGAVVRLAAHVRLESHWHANSNTPTFDYLIPTELSLELPVGSSEPEFVYPAHKMLAFPFTEGPIAVYDGTFDILADFALPAELADGLVMVEGSLRYQACDDKQCLPPITTKATFELHIGSGGQPVALKFFDAEQSIVDTTAALDPTTDAPTKTLATNTNTGGGLLWMILLGLVGGFILNAMPCVLPVLSIKIFGLVQSAGKGRSQLLAGSLATTAGILVSFWALAAAITLAGAAGAAVGWGVQFQYPGFVAFLAVVVALFSLNMWGLFEIPLPASLSRLTGGTQKEGLAGHFFSGLFTTLMATPCSAPFLGTAVGFAMTQSPLTTFTIFTAVGLGLALPYLLIAFIPKTMDLIPKPGAWMETFRGMMGFLLAAAAVWLFYVLAAQVSPERLAGIQLTLLGLALASWLFGKAQPETTGRRLAAAGILAASFSAILLAAQAPPATALTVSQGEGPIDWIQFDEQEARRLSGEENRLVFVDFTADWCLTCKANERLVINTKDVAEAFERYDVVAMKGDWTNRDDTITEFLARYGRSAVPFYILFRPGQEPHLFGELLSRKSILDALATAEQVASGKGL
jgi:thiol:disulfide interchange protein